MSEERTSSRAARERGVIPRHSLYNPEASGPVVGEGYVAQRVRIFEDIFRQHWIPVEKAPHELHRRFVSLTSLRSFRSQPRDPRSRSALSKAYVPIENMSGPLRTRRLSGRRVQLFGSTASIEYKGPRSSNSTPSKRIIGDNEWLSLRLRSFSRNEDDSPKDLRSAVPSIIAPYIHSPEHTRLHSRIGGPRSFDEQVGPILREASSFDTPPRQLRRIHPPPSSVLHKALLGRNPEIGGIANVPAATPHLQGPIGKLSRGIWPPVRDKSENSLSRIQPQRPASSLDHHRHHQASDVLRDQTSTIDLRSSKPVSGGSRLLSHFQSQSLIGPECKPRSPRHEGPSQATKAAHKSTPPAISTKPDSPLDKQSLEPLNDYFGYASRRLQQDLYSLAAEAEESQSDRANTISTLQDVHHHISLGEPNAPSVQLIDGAPSNNRSGRQHRYGNADCEALPIAPSQENMKNSSGGSTESSSEILQSSPPKLLGTSMHSLPPMRRTSTLSRMLRKVSGWRLTLVDKDRGEGQVEDIPLQKAGRRASKSSTIRDVSKDLGTDLQFPKYGQPSTGEAQARSETQVAPVAVLANEDDSRQEVVPQGSGRAKEQNESRPWHNSLNDTTSQYLSQKSQRRLRSNSNVNPQQSRALNQPRKSATIWYDSQLGTCTSTPSLLDLQSSRTLTSESLPITPPPVPKRSSAREVLQSMPERNPKSLTTPTGSRRLRPSNSWIKHPSQSSVTSHMSPASYRTADSVTGNATSNRRSSNRVTAESAPKVGSLAALTYLKNSRTTYKRTDKPSISVEVLPATSDSSSDDENPEDTGDDRMVEDSSAMENPQFADDEGSQGSSRASLYLRGSKGRRERVKKVSVVVSLDGPADLRIDTSVRRRRLAKRAWGKAITLKHRVAPIS